MVRIMVKKAALSFFLGIFSLAGCTSPGAVGIGVLDGKLNPCPASPNCVSSQSPGGRHGMEAIPYTMSGNEAKGRLRNIIKGMEGSSIVSEKDDYIHAEYCSALFRFVDDVEFYLDDTRKLIHFRSASRVGYYDFGVNRKRMEAIREKFLAP
ncbi:MAG: DUF1499 domain-containing protein [Deltaproteobacteria bacterium]|nr:DUF1499 domain-containing protein [Deltaproteobacteria bacterium]